MSSPQQHRSPSALNHLKIWSQPLFKRGIALGMSQLFVVSSTAGGVFLAWEQKAFALNPIAIAPRIEETAGEKFQQFLLRRLWGHTPCPPIRPDCDRNLAPDIGDSLAGDFVVSKQTPFRTGRNEVLITSPSTGTEQRFEINLPNTGDFQLYKASFDKVKVSNPEKVLGVGASLSPQQVAAKLQNFEIEFEQNAPKTVVLADGTRGEFSAGGVVIRSKDGRVIETVGASAMRGRRRSRLMAAVPVGSDAVVAQAGSGGGSCQGSIRNELYKMSQKVHQKGADILKQKATSEEAKLIAWVTTFSRQALEDSLIADNRNQTLQEVACAKPVQCNEPQSYNGGWETRTDLFKLPGGKNTLSLRYEFYQIPDSIELWREGKKITKIGPKSGSATVPISDSALNGNGYVGVKVIGNPTNQGTLWNYTISCSGSEEKIAELCPIPQQTKAEENSNRLNHQASFRKSLARVKQFNNQPLDKNNCPTLDLYIVMWRSYGGLIRWNEGPENVLEVLSYNISSYIKRDKLNIKKLVGLSDSEGNVIGHAALYARFTDENGSNREVVFSNTGGNAGFYDLFGVSNEYDRCPPGLSIDGIVACFYPSQALATHLDGKWENMKDFRERVNEREHIRVSKHTITGEDADIKFKMLEEIYNESNASRSRSAGPRAYGLNINAIRWITEMNQRPKPVRKITIPSIGNPIEIHGGCANAVASVLKAIGLGKDLIPQDAEFSFLFSFEKFNKPIPILLDADNDAFDVNKLNGRLDIEIKDNDLSQALDAVPKQWIGETRVRFYDPNYWWVCLGGNKSVQECSKSNTIDRRIGGNEFKSIINNR